MKQQPAAGNVIDGTDRLFVVTPPEALDELSRSISFTKGESESSRTQG